MMILTLFFWFLIGGACSYFATQRGRDPYAWLSIGLFLGVLGLILLFLLPKVEAKETVPSDEVDSKISEDENLKPPFSAKDWFYLDQSHQQHGPLSFDQLKILWDERTITKSTFIWSEGMAEWKKIQDLTELNFAPNQ